MAALYCDSVNGSDSNDGLTAETALSTISAVQSAYNAASSVDHLLFARGSVWQEQFNPGTTRTGVRCDAYGTGDTPHFLCADVADNAGWTLSGHANAGGVVYQRTWELASSIVTDSDTNRPGGWEDDAPLTFRSTVAACAANPGSIHFPTISGSATTLTVYLHPFDSTDPTTDGKTYEISRRYTGINGGLSPELSISGIKVSKGFSKDGLGPGPNGRYVRRCISRGWGLHHCVSGCDVTEDLIFLEPHYGLGQSYFPLTWYLSDAGGRDVVVKRCFWGSGSDPSGNNKGFYTHGSTSAPGSMYYEQCHGVRLAGPDNGPLTARGCNGSYYTGNVSTIDQCIGSFEDSGPVNTGTFLRHFTDSYHRGSGAGGNVALRAGTYRFDQCVLHKTNQTAGGGQTFTANGLLNIEITNSIVIGGSTTGHTLLLMHNAAATDTIRCNFSGDGNLYVGNPRVTLNNSTVTTDINNWFAVSGETNSAWMTQAQYTTTNGGLWLGDTSEGDYRINPDAVCTWPNGTVASTLPDGTPLTALGPQNHWDWPTRQSVPGPMLTFPQLLGPTVVPRFTEAEAETYLASLPDLVPVLAVTRGEDGIDDAGTDAVGTVVQGSSQTLTYTLINSGDIDLEIGTITVGDGLTITTDPSGETVAPFGSTTLALTLSTASVGAVAAEVTIPTNEAAASYGWTVTATVADQTAPTLDDPTIPSAGTTILLTADEAVSLASGRSYADITLAGVSRTVASGSVDGATITLILSGAVLPSEDEITVTVPAGTFEDAAGNPSDALTAVAVANNSTEAVPYVVSRQSSATGLTVTTTFSEAVTGNVGFSFEVNGEVRPASYLSGLGTNKLVHQFSAANRLQVGDTVTQSYAGGDIVDSVGFALADFSEQAVTNNTAEASGFPDSSRVVAMPRSGGAVANRILTIHPATVADYALDEQYRLADGVTIVSSELEQLGDGIEVSQVRPNDGSGRNFENRAIAAGRAVIFVANVDGAEPGTQHVIRLITKCSNGDVLGADIKVRIKDASDWVA